MELINTHCHTKYCGHGEGDVSEYVDEAKRAGIKTLAFTDHYPLSKAFDPVGYLSIPEDKLQDYIDAVRKAQKANDDIEILLGIELDYLSDYEDRKFDEDEFDKYDIILGSVHFVDKWPFDDPAQRDVWNEEGKPDQIWQRYVDIWCEAASNKNTPFKIMSHPDLAKKFNYYPSIPLGDFYKKMAEAASAGNKMIELNTSGSYYLCEEMFPSSDLLKEFHRAGIKCTLGTDAHVPTNVARDIEKGYKKLYDAGYRELTVPTKNGDYRTISIS